MAYRDDDFPVPASIGSASASAPAAPAPRRTAAPPAKVYPRKPNGAGVPAGRDSREAMLATIPSLRAFAISLTSNVDRADDLVQDTVLRAWSHFDSFQPGTNLQAWLFTILRNLFHSEYRKRRREIEDPDNAFARKLAVLPEQTARLDWADFHLALAKLPPDQREAVLLIGAEGFSYDETARICGVAVGTVKSRVNRARKRLTELLALKDDEEEFGPDRLLQAALNSGDATPAKA